MQELTLDVRKRACGFGKSRRLYDVRRGEINSAELSVKITDGGEPYDLTGKKVRFRCETGLCNGVFDDEDGGIAIDNAEEGAFLHTLPKEAASDVGYASCYYDIYKDDGSYLTTTEGFGFTVIEDADLSAQQAEHYVPMLDRLISEGNEAVGKVSESLEKVGESLGKVEQAAESAEGALAKANEAAEKAEAAANTANQAVEVVDGIKGDAASAIGAANSAASDAASAASSANSAASLASSAAASASSAASAAENAAKSANDAAGNLDATVGEALAGKADAEHAHSAADITSGTLDAERLPAATTITAGAVKLTDFDKPEDDSVLTWLLFQWIAQNWNEEVNNALAGKANASHTHTAAQVGAMPAVAVTASDAGKFLRVQSDGTWAAEAIPSASGVSF